MHIRFLAVTAVWLALLLPAMGFGADQVSLAVGDSTAPTIQHDPLEGPIASHRPLIISATASDASGIERMTLFFRTKGDAEFHPYPMNRLDNEQFVTTIPPEEVRAPGVEYYIQAEDNSGNTILRGVRFSPLTASVEPVSIETSGGSENAGGAIGMDAPATTAAAVQAPTRVGEAKESKTSAWKWVLGAVAVGAVLAMAGGDGGGGGDPAAAPPANGGAAGEITIVAPVPQ